MGRFGIGQAMHRVEDARLLTGTGRYADDVRLANTAIGYVVRAPFAHAEITGIDTAAARTSAGVLGVYTVADLDGDNVGAIPCVAALKSKDGTPAHQTPRPVLARDRVRYVGEPVAFVVAETLEQAKDAAELVEVDYEPLDAVASPVRARSETAVQLWPEAAGNLAFDWEVGDAAAVDQAFAQAAHVARVELVNNRVAPTAIEPRAAVGVHSAQDGYTLYSGSQGVAGMRGMVAAILNVDPETIRVVTGDVGGGFGMKAFVYAEYVLALWAAGKLGRPVRWTGDRAESFMNDSHGRDLVSVVELALDGDARFVGYRVHTKANLGAYNGLYGPFVPTMAAVQVLGGPYRMPCLHVGVEGVFTNTVPVDAYRGAGRPEAAYMLERAVNQAAIDLGLDQDEIRRRNFATSDQMPHTTALGTRIDSGDFAGNMADAMTAARWDSFATRRDQAQAAGRLRGIGMAYYVECTLGAPTEDVDVAFTDDDRVRLSVGTQSNGQGHETTFAQVLADKLGIDADLVDVVQGDTDIKATGGGTGGSRSLHMIGGASLAAADAVADKGRQLAARLFDTDADTVEYADGEFRVPDTNQRIGLFELNRQASSMTDLPEDMTGGLSLTASYTNSGSTFPNGCHICEVEVDPETGVVDVVDYTVVDDFGVVVNPMVVAGQVHGGVVQGIGQALVEHCVYSDEDGQLITGSFMDYGIPRADDVSDIAFSFNEVPCQTNPLGVKGCGEAGTIGALPSTMNAIIDALRPHGITHVDMPATPHAIWQLLNGRAAAE